MLLEVRDIPDEVPILLLVNGSLLAEVSVANTRSHCMTPRGDQNGLHVGRVSLGRNAYAHGVLESHKRAKLDSFQSKVHHHVKVSLHRSNP